MKAWTLGPGQRGAGRGSQHPASSWLVLLSVDPPGTQTGAQERGTQIPVPWEHIPTGPGAAAREGQVQKSRREAVAAINKCSAAFLC